MATKNISKVTVDILRSRSRSPTKSKVKSKCLLVSNIPFTTTFNDLKDLFKEKIGICGKLEFIERNGKFTGNATMEFKTLDGAQKAVDVMHKQEINGREIIVREETPKDRDRLNLNFQTKNNNNVSTGQYHGSLSQLVNDLQREGPITNSLFIANLDYNLTWQKVKDIFKNAGRVRHVDLKLDAEGKSRGFGTIEFETPEEAILAIHLFNNNPINNREIRLRMDKSGKALSGRLDLSKFTDNDGSLPSNCSSLDPQIKRIFEDVLIASSNPNRKNPQALKALNELLTLAKLFEKPLMQNQFSDMDRDFGFGGISTIRNWTDMPGSVNDNYVSSNFLNNRSGLMHSKSSNSYNDFISKPRDYPPASSRESEYNDSSRNVGYNNNNGSGLDMSMVEDMLFKMKSCGNLDQSSLMNVISNVMKRSPESSNTFMNSRSEDFLPGRQSSTLLIKNIPFSYSWKDLKVSFSQVAGIDQIEILRDDFNRSKGMGMVRFETHSDAVRCKNLMDGTLLDGRPIHIEFSNML